MHSKPIPRLSVLNLALFTILGSLPAMAQEQQESTESSKRVTASSTSNTTSATDTKRVQELDRIDVRAKSPVLGDGSMMIQTAPKAISTITRDAIQQEAGGSNFTQLIDTIPGVDASSDDPSGLANGNYSLRGFDSSAIGITVNGAPITDSGTYSVYATEYGDAENYNDITVLQGTPNVDMPDMGASGGHIAWSTIDPSHDFGVDFTQSFGTDDYKRSFVRFNTGDTGPVRSWISFSDNSKDKWKSQGDMKVTKIDGKSLWTIDDSNSISLSFQYSRQSNYSYYSGSKAQIQADYDYDTADTWTAGTGAVSTGATTYYKLRRNPYKSIMLSLDGEFTLSDNLSLSVVPYYWYGDGGSGSGSQVYEASPTASSGRYTTYNVYYGSYPDVPEDINGDGKYSQYTVAYAYNYAKTTRPGVVVKFIQNLGLDHTLSYGGWLERSNKTQTRNFNYIDQATGEPCDVWGEDEACQIHWADGSVVSNYWQSTQTTVQKYFVQDNWTPSDKLQINLGAAYLHAVRKGTVVEWPGANYPSTSTSYRLETAVDFDKGYSEFLPAFGIKFSPDERNQIFYGVAKTFRLPPTNAITFSEIAISANEAKNRVSTAVHTDPETAITHDLGWRYYGDRFGTAVMLYQSDYKNKEMPGYDNVTGLAYSVWIPKVRMRGANWEGSYAISKQWKTYLSYTYTEAEVSSTGLVDTGGDGAFPLHGKQLANTPKNIATARLSWSNGEFWASLKAKYSGSRYGDYMNTEKVGGYTVVSFNSGVNLPDIGVIKKPALKLNVFNLFDRKAFTYVSSTQWVSAAGKAEAVADGVDGASDWYSSTSYYGVLAPRAITVTFSGSF